MSVHTVLFAAGGGADGAWNRWVKPLRDFWPGDQRPNTHCLPLDGFLSLLEGRLGVGVEATMPTAALVVLGPGERPQTVDRLVEGLHARNVPAVVVMPEPSEWRTFQKHGVLFERYETEPAAIAAMLYALAERQGAVEVLSREVYVAQRAQGGIRLEMDRLHEELHMAAAVQREFLPTQLPRVPGLEFGMVFRPVNYVSGDIFDVETLDERHVGFFLADAVGHGVPAALLTMILSYSLSTTEEMEEGRAIVEPSRVLRRLNERLCHARAGSGRFATAVYGVIDTGAMTVTLAGAGHPPPLLVGDDLCRAVETDGPLLGVFPEAEFPQETFALDGRTLLLYTDGLECAFPGRSARKADLRRANKQYLEHLARIAAGCAGRSPQEMMDELAALLDEQAGSLHQVDDVTALAIAPRREAARLAA